MASNIYPRESGVIYRSTVDSVLKIEDATLRGKFAVAILQYLLDGDYSFKGEDNILDALMIQPIYTMDQAAGRYDEAVEQGKKGGTKSRFTDEDVYKYRVVEGHSVKEATARFGYSERTIRDKVANYKKVLAAEARIKEDIGLLNKGVEPAKTEVATPEKAAGEFCF